MPKTYPGLFSDGVDAEKRIISQHFAHSTKLTDSNFRIISQKINFRFVFACGSSSSGSGQRPRGIRFSACSGGRRVVQTHPVELRARSTPLAPPAGAPEGRRDAEGTPPVQPPRQLAARPPAAHADAGWHGHGEHRRTSTECCCLLASLVVRVCVCLLQRFNVY